jgi:hypothetical protein
MPRISAHDWKLMVLATIMQAALGIVLSIIGVDQIQTPLVRDIVVGACLFGSILIGPVIAWLMLQQQSRAQTSPPPENQAAMVATIATDGLREAALLRPLLDTGSQAGLQLARIKMLEWSKATNKRLQCAGYRDAALIGDTDLILAIGNIPFGPSLRRLLAELDRRAFHLKDCGGDFTQYQQAIDKGQEALARRVVEQAQATALSERKVALLREVESQLGMPLSTYGASLYGLGRGQEKREDTTQKAVDYALAQAKERGLEGMPREGRTAEERMGAIRQWLRS